MKFEFIHEHRHEHTISRMCQVLGVSKSGYYDYLNRLDREETKREAWNRYIDERILFHYHDNYGCYGSPRIHFMLREVDQVEVSQKKVTNRMRELDLYATPPKKFINTTDSDHDETIHSNHLNRDFLPEAPDQVWATDITYIHTGEGFLYLNPVIDLASRRIISYQLDDHMDHTLCLKALEKALAIRNPKSGWIHHSDRGSQYCSKAYLDTLKEAGATISMSRKGNPYDNACAESFFASLKKEYLYKHVYETKAEAKLAIQFYINFYNQKRLHSTLDYLTPLEKEKSYKMNHDKKLKKNQMSSA
ncbi:IS3 family transposase [Halobacillus amylolyticus]|uniref:IS3 family transposase n=1 Tax=Halobacillus amylolyticus TaxID=2932259 RepID=A0ABY4HAC9_9BACI|nr:IS3 family transposase [Halobacillus amylolyticus]UOR10905.1 IS3 family transposase [Halobacillus amylolyticus]